MNRVLSLQGMSVSYASAAENSGVSATCAGNSCVSYNCGDRPVAPTVDPSTPPAAA
jgi:hypothetical protein